MTELLAILQLVVGLVLFFAFIRALMELANFIGERLGFAKFVKYLISKITQR